MCLALSQKRGFVDVAKLVRRVYRFHLLSNALDFGFYYSAPRNANRSRKITVSTQIKRLISRNFPAPTLMQVNDSKPKLNPVAILKVSGVATSVRNAGKASLKSSHSILASDPHINPPTRIKAGAVA